MPDRAPHTCDSEDFRPVSRLDAATALKVLGMTRKTFGTIAGAQAPNVSAALSLHMPPRLASVLLELLDEADLPRPGTVEWDRHERVQATRRHVADKAERLTRYSTKRTVTR